MEMIAFLYFLVGIALAATFVFGVTSDEGKEHLSSMIPTKLEHSAGLISTLVVIYFVGLIFLWPLLLMKFSFDDQSS
jgi:hypothetical protein